MTVTQKEKRTEKGGWFFSIYSLRVSFLLSDHEKSFRVDGTLDTMI